MKCDASSEFDELHWDLIINHRCTLDGFLIRKYIKFLPDGKMKYWDVQIDLSITPRYSFLYVDCWFDENGAIHFVQKKENKSD